MQQENISQAVNEETGEINWDCPCLKSALEPPCGNAFKVAFECFVKSKSEPKGMECEESFIKLQKCFQENSAHYDALLGKEIPTTKSLDNKSE